MFDSIYVKLLEKEFILGENSESRMNLEGVQESTDMVDQIDKSECGLTPDEGHILDLEVETSENRSALCKSYRIIQPLRRYESMITNQVLLIEDDEPIGYTK